MATTRLGTPCGRGHSGLRYMANGKCVVCHTLRERLRAQRDPQRSRARAKEWRLAGYPTPTRSQPPGCELCSRRVTKNLCLDHDHSTGKFRGWLCTPCNAALGQLGDDVSGLMRAVTYLKNHV